MKLVSIFIRKKNFKLGSDRLIHLFGHEYSIDCFTLTCWSTYVGHFEPIWAKMESLTQKLDEVQNQAMLNVLQSAACYKRNISLFWTWYDWLIHNLFMILYDYQPWSTIDYYLHWECTKITHFDIFIRHKLKDLLEIHFKLTWVDLKTDNNPGMRWFIICFDVYMDNLVQKVV